ncbi:hypothetical protein E1301_Tti005438 [Triplophysa tibetana]|uniref:Uncharacterized protein n=1 Tax=Triplophysa tibetana TaxID=1572043 RepID=A0A5A9PQN1_9TELE|nr:hypothetical protein E1301_Tti005438 [Triplophysa tibetana]
MKGEGEKDREWSSARGLYNSVHLSAHFFNRGLTEIQITGSFHAHEILIVTGAFVWADWSGVVEKAPFFGGKK